MSYTEDWEQPYRALLEQYRATDTPVEQVVLPKANSYVSDAGYMVDTFGNKITGAKYIGAPARTTSSSSTNPWWANTGIEQPQTTSTQKIGSSTPTRSYGYAATSSGQNKPMPYFEGLTDKDGMQISRWDSNYWKMPDAPTLELPTYSVPARDETRIQNLIQQAGATGANKLARGLTQALTKAGSEESPMAKKQIMRGALSGYGQGLGDVMSQANTQGRAQYEQEYQPYLEANRINYEGKTKEALADYSTETQRINSMYEAALKDYFGR